MQKTQKTLTPPVNPPPEDNAVEGRLDVHAPSVAGAIIADSNLLSVANRALAPKKPPKTDRPKPNRASKSRKSNN